MTIESIQAASLQVPFRQEFRHASKVRSGTETLWVEARAQGLAGFGEGCPRSYVTGESIESAARFVADCRQEWIAEIYDADSLRRWVAHRRAVIDRNPAAWCAVELALLDLFGRIEGRTVEALLGLPPLSGLRCYTAVLGDAPMPQFEAQLAQYARMGFSDYKIKLSGEPARDRAKVRALAAAGIAGAAVRADANGLWREAPSAIAHLDALDYAFAALEEPLAPGDFDGLRQIAARLGTRIVLDESLLRIGQLGALARDPPCWVVNLRVSKLGGLLRSLELVDALHRARIAVICGAHVGETSLLTRAALTVAARAGKSLVAMEGAFGTRLLCRDVTETPIMFRARGCLDAARIPRAAGGLGIAVSRPTGLLPL